VSSVLRKAFALDGFYWRNEGARAIRQLGKVHSQKRRDAGAGVVFTLELPTDCDSTVAIP
jgi:hypothetical protein